MRGGAEKCFLCSYEVVRPWLDCDTGRPRLWEPTSDLLYISLRIEFAVYQCWPRIYHWSAEWRGVNMSITARVCQADLPARRSHHNIHWYSIWIRVMAASRNITHNIDSISSHRKHFVILLFYRIFCPQYSGLHPRCLAVDPSLWQSCWLLTVWSIGRRRPPSQTFKLLPAPLPPSTQQYLSQSLSSIAFSFLLFRRSAGLAGSLFLLHDPRWFLLRFLDVSLQVSSGAVQERFRPEEV